MWCEEFKIRNSLAEISQNLTFPHFPLFEIFAHLCICRYLHSLPSVSFIVSDFRSCIYIELVLYLITFKNVKSKGHLFCLSKLIVMLQICFDTIALSSVVNVINVTTPKNRGAKSETPDAISGT